MKTVYNWGGQQLLTATGDVLIWDVGGNKNKKLTKEKCSLAPPLTCVFLADDVSRKLFFSDKCYVSRRQIVPFSVSESRSRRKQFAGESGNEEQNEV